MTQTFAIVIDPITDETETAESCLVRCAGSEIKITDPEAIRAFYECASAKAYGEGSYTVSVEDFDEIVGK